MQVLVCAAARSALEEVATDAIAFNIKRSLNFWQDCGKVGAYAPIAQPVHNPFDPGIHLSLFLCPFSLSDHEMNRSINLYHSLQFCIVIILSLKHLMLLLSWGF